MTARQTVRNHIVNNTSFTWCLDCVERIHGFRGAPYKSFNRALALVKSVIAEMDAEGVLDIVPPWEPGYAPTIYYIGR